MTIEIDHEAFRKALYQWELDAPIELLTSTAAYKRHFLDEYGIMIGTFGQDMRVIDEHKYTIFMLRWA